MLRGRIVFTPCGESYTFDAPTRFDKLFSGVCENSAVIEMRTADAAVLTVVEQALDPELLAAVVDRRAEKLSGHANLCTRLEAQLRRALQKRAADWRAMLRRRAENVRAILRRFVAERFVFTPNPAGGYLFREKAISAYYFKWRPRGIRERVERRFSGIAA